MMIDFKFDLPERPLTNAQMMAHISEPGLRKVALTIWGPKPWPTKDGIADPAAFRKFVRGADGLWHLEAE